MNEKNCFVCLILGTSHEHKCQGRSCSFRKGQILLHQGLPTNGIYYIQKGLVKSYSIDNSGRENIHSLNPAGELIGISSIFKDSLSVFSAEAKEDTQCSYIEKDSLLDLIHLHPALMDEALLRFTKKLKAAYHRNNHFISCSVKERLAQSLIDLSDHMGEKDKEKTRINVRLNREELASVLGVAQETAIRAISDFKKKKYITESDHQFIIQDMPALVKISNEGKLKV